MELTVGICAAVFKTDYKVAFKESLSDSLRRVLASNRDRTNYYDTSNRGDRVSIFKLYVLLIPVNEQLIPIQLQRLYLPVPDKI